MTNEFLKFVPETLIEFTISSLLMSFLVPGLELLLMRKENALQMSWKHWLSLSSAFFVTLKFMWRTSFIRREVPATFFPQLSFLLEAVCPFFSNADVWLYCLTKAIIMESLYNQIAKQVKCLPFLSQPKLPNLKFEYLIRSITWFMGPCFSCMVVVCAIGVNAYVFWAINKQCSSICNLVFNTKLQ